MPKKLSTQFAPAGRASSHQLAKEQNTINTNEFIRSLLDAMPDPAVILNKSRQIVAVNNRLLEVFGAPAETLFIGLRPGEAFMCIHHTEGPDGCGTAASCSVCGAVITILTTMDTNQQTRGECRLTVQKDGGTALDLEMLGTPLTLDDEQLMICAIKDISAEKRKSVMERMFFHDIINAAGGIRGLATLLVEQEEIPQETEREYKQWILTLSDSLIDDIKHQRNLLAAENGEYVPRYEEVDLAEMVTRLKELFVHHEKVPGRDILLESYSPMRIASDPPVLRRIVGNMLLNALEASPKGETVTVRYGLTDETVRIEVENPGEIPPDIQLQIFNRSFSTKSKHGRGIGTYSMKLFGERYLGGEVGFISSNGRTVFYITLPCIN